MRFEFINLQKKAYPVYVMCRVLEVSRSGFFSWLKRMPSRRKADRDRLKVLVMNIQKRHHSSCGSRRKLFCFIKEGKNYENDLQNPPGVIC